MVLGIDASRCPAKKMRSRMAKGKHTRALFEVISKSKQFAPAQPKAAGGSWWPLGRRSSTAQATVVAPTAVASPAAPVLPPEPVTYAAPIVQADAPRESYSSPRARQVFSGGADRFNILPTVADPLHKSLEYAVDPDRKVIAFRMNYTVAIVATFALMVIVALAVVVGEHMRGEPVPLMTQSMASVQQQSANRSVMVVPPLHTSSSTPARVKGNADQASQLLTPSKPTPPSFNEPRPPVDFAANDGKRYLGLNYVIIQSYYPSEEKMAKEACDFLKKNNVDCTIESGKGLKGWRPDSILVVGTKGFDRISGQAFKDYEAQIQKLSLAYAGSAKSYKAFQPSPKKWDRKSDQQ